MRCISRSGPIAVAAVFLSAVVAVAADRTATERLHHADQAGVARVIDVPYLSQTEALCGGAALAMVLRYWGERQVYAEDFAALVDWSAAGIRTDVLAAAARRRGWQAFLFTGTATLSGEWIRHHVDRRRPVVALIEERPGTFHYVVVVGWTADTVIAHDPARAPFRVMARTEFAHAWARAGQWALLLLPTEARLERELPSPPPSADPVRAVDTCGALVEESVLRARSGDVRAAEDGLRAAIVFCPTDASPWRELAGLRFLESRWAEASRSAERAVRLGATGPDDAHTWELLGTSRFLDENHDRALDAWNRIDRPHVDIVNVEGGDRTRRPIIDDLLNLAPRTLLTANLLRRTRHRLEELPAAAASSVSFRPIDGGLAEVDATIDERPTVPWGVVPVAAAAGRAWAVREVRIDIAGPTSRGELWSGSWRWADARPRIAFTLAVPAPGRLPGVATLEASWERQSYRAPLRTADAGLNGLQRNDRRRAALGFSDWATGNLRWHAGGGLDRWGDDSHFSADTALDLRLASDRLSFGVEAAGWIPLQSGRRFVRGSLSAAWRSAPDTPGPSWSASTGFIVASRAAPFDLWPGAGTGHARPTLLRAHPLLNHGVVEGAVFGRRLAHASAEYQHPLRTGIWGRLHLAGFADAARAWQHIEGRSAPLHVDVGTGLRIAAPGLGGTVRLDVARGLRDGRVVFSTGWRGSWPGR